MVSRSRSGARKLVWSCGLGLTGSLPPCVQHVKVNFSFEKEVGTTSTNIATAHNTYKASCTFQTDGIANLQSWINMSSIKLERFELNWIDFHRTQLNSNMWFQLNSIEFKWLPIADLRQSNSIELNWHQFERNRIPLPSALPICNAISHEQAGWLASRQAGRHAGLIAGLLVVLSGWLDKLARTPIAPNLKLITRDNMHASKKWFSLLSFSSGPSPSLFLLAFEQHELDLDTLVALLFLSFANVVQN